MPQIVKMNFTAQSKRLSHFARRGPATKVLLMLALCLATPGMLQAQAKRHPAATSKRAFSLPCPRALSIGLREVERLYDREQARRYTGDTDSGTEAAATQNALRNYLTCRRTDNLARLTQLEPSARTELNTQTASATRLARTRFGLINGIAFDEHAADPINRAMTQHALALIEDYRGQLLIAFTGNDPEFVAEQRAAERDRKSIEGLLAKLESKDSEADDTEDYRRKLASLRQAIAKMQTDNADVEPSEKVAMMRFILALVKLGLPDEQ